MNLHNQMQQIKRNRGEIDIQPKENMEYIYIHDLYWSNESLDSIKLDEYKIVKNVRLNNGRFTFEFIDMEGTYHCNYGWAFVENTEYGRNTLAFLDLEREELRQQQAIVNEIHDRLPTLYKRI